MIDLFLQSNIDMLNSPAQAAFYFKDLPGYFDVVTYIGVNSGFSERPRPTKDGEEMHIEGVLFSDFSNGQNRAILNGVSINFNFFQSTNPFGLLRNDNKAYKLKITDAILKVCHISLDPKMIVAHNEALKISPALYPFWRSDIKKFTVASGSLSHMTDNIYHGKIPSELIIAIVLNSSYSGSYDKTLFKHINLNYLEVAVDGQSVPNRALSPNFEGGDFVSSHLSLSDNECNKKKGLVINLLEYKGFTLFLFDIQSYLSGKIMSKSMNRHHKVNMRFSKALAETINVLVYAKYPETLTINHTRNVNIQ